MVVFNGYSSILARCARLSIEPTQHAIHVSLGEKKLRHFLNGALVRTYDTAFGINPPSCVENSLGTPTGLHFIDEKIGDGAPEGMVFIGRIPTGKRYWEYGPEEKRNFVTTRILWLRGLEPGHNAGPGCDSHDRYIYIHGTNLEADFANARSHGCVLLRNAEMIDFYNAVPSGTLVLIE
ncbi:L,D-transpeptidase [Ruficoccus amylovorans]|uniref:L,D-transpeptidase n=1 Tax=Ruficoccus amylovorans TaxID=1804625 RepID=A0A842HBQ6_9BACT|nr:L,D-transpeptidase [Ruficoccus amylovorans]MBC2593700.1 L,D-transpeptidase [Ruficoccus amylovorans]